MREMMNERRRRRRERGEDRDSMGDISVVVSQ